ncbi:MAG TPA: DUF3553 domain-containing protein [Sandaracinaceae bacterium LLY-WYZ-13_1]|nr:DUF3553 domain-containing protein [Sandaracinaceae bacterium LLY-WYZ-13_1]
MGTLLRIDRADLFIDAGDLRDLLAHERLGAFANLQRELAEDGWALERDGDGNVVDIDYLHEKLTGDIDRLLPRLTPWIRPGSHVELTGGVWLRYDFDGGRCVATLVDGGEETTEVLYPGPDDTPPGPSRGEHPEPIVVHLLAWDWLVRRVAALLDDYRDRPFREGPHPGEALQASLREAFASLGAPELIERLDRWESVDDGGLALWLEDIGLVGFDGPAERWRADPAMARELVEALGATLAFDLADDAPLADALRARLTDEAAAFDRGADHAVGALVRHPTHGLGRVDSIEGDRIHLTFERAGRKTFLRRG